MNQKDESLQFLNKIDLKHKGQFSPELAKSRYSRSLRFFSGDRDVIQHTKYSSALVSKVCYKTKIHIMRCRFTTYQDARRVRLVDGLNC